MSNKFLYETGSDFKIGEKVNTGKASIVKSRSLVVPIVSPLYYGDGSNPDQLLALSIVSCFSLHLNDI